MPESGTYGSVRGVPGNGHPYREEAESCRLACVRRVRARHLGQCGESLDRELPIEISNSDLRQAVCPFIGPSHLLLLRHAMTDHLVHRGLGILLLIGSPLR